MRLGEAALMGMGVCAGAVLAVCPALAEAPGTPRAPAPGLVPDAPLPPLSEARPPLPPEPERAPVPWEHHIEVGGGVAFTKMLTSI
jgi:hypothetical protein